MFSSQKGSFAFKTLLLISPRFKIAHDDEGGGPRKRQKGGTAEKSDGPQRLGFYKWEEELIAQVRGVGAQVPWRLVWNFSVWARWRMCVAQKATLQFTFSIPVATEGAG